MNLKTYCQHNNLTFKSLAEKLDLSPAFITQMINGSRRPSPKVALRIEKALNGEVDKLELLYPDI